MKNKLIFASSLTSLLPFVALAGGAGTNEYDPDFQWITDVIAEIAGVIGSFIPIFVGIALLVFIWGVVRFISADDDSGRSDGKKRIVWGIVGLFIVISVWGLVLLIQQLAGIQGAALEDTDLPNIPGLDAATADPAAV